MIAAGVPYVIGAAGEALAAAGTGAAIDATIADALGTKALAGLGDAAIGTALGAANRAAANYAAVSGKEGKVRKQKDVVVQTTAKSGSKKPRTGPKLSSAGRQTSASDYNALFSRERLLDANLVEQAGSQKLVTLQMKLGKKKYENPIPNFLSNLSGRGTVTNEWGGILSSDGQPNQRKFFMTMFRHRLVGPAEAGEAPDATATIAPANSNTQSVPYAPNSSANPYLPYDNFPDTVPTTNLFTNAEMDMSDFILYPNAPPIVLGGQTGLGTVKSMYHVHGDGRTFWTPLNRADYEDMSWNLNKLKLGQVGFENNQEVLPLPDPATPGSYYWPNQASNDPDNLQKDDLGAAMKDLFVDQAALFKKDAHRKQSCIQINNVQNEYNYEQAIQNAPYKYNMCFNGGVIDYNFMNKEASPCKVTVVVYKVKKNAKLPSKIAQGSASSWKLKTWADTLWNRDLLVDAIGEGFVQSQVTELGTDNLAGRTPEKSDVYALPQFPFLPELKRTIQANCPYKEVMRNEFAMPSGSHRHVVVNLPGDIYDPANVPIQNARLGWNYTSDGEADDKTNYKEKNQVPYGLDAQSTMDEHSYMVVIACAGMVGTRFLTKDADYEQSGTDIGTFENDYNTPIGSNFGPFNLQYTCKYSEDISGCLYKTAKKKKVFVQGKAPILAIGQPSGVNQVIENQQAIIPINHGVRVPNALGLRQTATNTATPFSSITVIKNSGTVGTDGNGA